MRLRLRAGVALFGVWMLAACAGVSPPAPAPLPPVRQAMPPAPASPPALEPPPPPEVRRVPLSSLQGWESEDYVAALLAFRQGCGAARAPAWRAVCRRAREQEAMDSASARAFFEDNFQAEVGVGDAGLLTAYFAPEYPARAAPDEIFSAAVRPKPDDLVMAARGEPGSGRRAMLRAGEESLPYPDRAAIEAAPPAGALAYMRPEDLFFLQIQGSGSLVFPDGRRVKAVYAADNGRPFVAIARPMAEAGLLAPSEVSADGIRGWLADHRGPDAQAVMNRNPRYVFFRLAPEDDVDPAGAAGIALPPGRSLAVDPAYHAFGELFWIDAEAPTLSGARPLYRRLALALDTGSAIRGAARADLYLGRGEEAGLEAGRVRHTLQLVRLVPAAPRGRAARADHEPQPQG